MSSRSLRRRALPLLLCAGLLTSWASAATAQKPRAAQAAAPAASSLLDRAWRLLQSLWGEEGCRIDPDGRCATGATPAPRPGSATDTGCRIDPDGHCATGTTPAPAPNSLFGDEGCMIDPNGRCHT
jgi:hypothetical protein